MIFADKLIQLRKQKGWSQEELAEKMDVTRQSVSKWEGDQSVPDIERIIQLSDIFGVSLDYLLKDNVRDEVFSSDELQEFSEEIRMVDYNEAQDFIEVKKKTSTPMAIGVFLCVISPVCLLNLGALSEHPQNYMSENMAAGLGLIILLLFVAAAVVLFIFNGFKISKFEYIEKEIIETDLKVSKMIKNEKELFKNKFLTYNIIGTVLCVLAAIPLFTGMMIYENDDLLMTMSLSATIIVAAVGVAFFVKGGTIQGAFNMLLQEGDYSKDKKRKSSVLSAITVSYWLVATAVYLIWSFLTNSWEFTWVVWVAAGVLYPALLAIVNVALKRK